MSTSLRPTAQWLRWLALAMLLVGGYYLGNYGLTLASPTAQPSTPAVVSALPAPDASPMVNEAAAPATDLAPASSPRKLASAQGNAFNAILWLHPHHRQWCTRPWRPHHRPPLHQACPTPLWACSHANQRNPKRLLPGVRAC